MIISDLIYFSNFHPRLFKHLRKHLSTINKKINFCKCFIKEDTDIHDYVMPDILTYLTDLKLVKIA